MYAYLMMDTEIDGGDELSPGVGVYWGLITEPQMHHRDLWEQDHLLKLRADRGDLVGFPNIMIIIIP